MYDEIGQGRHSVVYKGRKKKTIKYVAVKSIDKDQKAMKIIQEENGCRVPRKVPRGWRVLAPNFM